MVAYGAKTYLDNAAETSLKQRNDSYREQQLQNERMLDMYGDRSSLEALERAVQAYEKK